MATWSSEPVKFIDSIAVPLSGGTGWQGFSICDDCREAYLDPPYYVFEVDACLISEGSPDEAVVIRHENSPEGCTGNLCPDCADDLEPDDEKDPRRA